MRKNLEVRLGSGEPRKHFTAALGAGTSIATCPAPYLGTEDSAGWCWVEALRRNPFRQQLDLAKRITHLDPSRAPVCRVPCGKLRRVVNRSACLVAALCVGVLAGCSSSSSPRSAAPSAGAVSAALRGSPEPLAAVHAQANQLLDGGTGAFRGRLGALRGYPVVVNKWASWCGPCQVEFPSFQRASVRYGRQVAFLGLDGKDHDQAAASFLRRFPVSYPSYTDPQESIARSIQAATYFPQTLYFDRRGKVVYDHAGPYLNAAALEQDIQRYVLGAR
jgi:cytochrome c biogenesis protein CcmG, thiol:disulfide interchange protein DsbE